MPLLPAGATWRRPTIADADAIYDLVAERNTAAVGFGDVTREDIDDELTEPDFDPDRDGWLVHGPDGTLLGWGWNVAPDGATQVDVDVYGRDPVVARWLFAAVLDRAAERARDGGLAAIEAHLGVYRADEEQRALAAEHGFEPATSFHRMRIDHAGVRAEPPAGEGVTVVTALADDDDLRRTTHALQQESFAGHFGFEAQSYDAWLEALEASSVHDWQLVEVALVDGEPAGFLIANNQFVPDENCGYVRSVGVIERFRGKGLARLLLERAFVRDAAAGRAGTLLHVDTANTTPALDLYLAVGMRPVLVIDVWTRPVPAA